METTVQQNIGFEQNFVCRYNNGGTGTTLSHSEAYALCRAYTGESKTTFYKEFHFNNKELISLFVNVSKDNIAMRLVIPATVKGTDSENVKTLDVVYNRFNEQRASNTDGTSSDSQR